MEEIKTWFKDNKDEFLFSLCIASALYCASRASYILGRSAGYLDAINDMASCFGVKVSKF